MLALDATNGKRVWDRTYGDVRAGESATVAPLVSLVVAFKMTELMNVERLMWANDFPHSDATWPNSQAMLAEHAAHLDDAARARILHDNAAELYGIRV